MAVHDIVMAAAGGTKPNAWIAKLATPANGVTSNSLWQTNVAIDADGNVYGGGRLGTGYCFLYKYNALGVLQWQKKYTTPTYTTGFTVLTVSAAGSLYVAGMVPILSGSWRTCTLITKIDSSGAIQWARYIFSNSNDPFCITTDTADNVYVGGRDGTNAVVYIAKLNSSGTFQWIKGYGARNAPLCGLKTDASGNIYSVSSFYSDYYASTIAVTMKANSSGVTQWSRYIKVPQGPSGIGYNATQNLDIDQSGNIYVATGSNVVKYDNTGTLLWQKRLWDNAGGICLDSSANSYIVSSYGLIYKLDSSGELVWQRQFSSSELPYVFQLYAPYVDSKQNLYINAVGQGDSQLWCELTIKVPADGSLTGSYPPFTYAVTTSTPVTTAYENGATTGVALAALSNATGTVTVTYAGTATLTPTTITL